MPTAVDSPAAPSAGWTWPPIPAWQIQSLQSLDTQGKLYGIPPQAIAVIDWAESNGNGSGGAINSKGYGGFFGLAPGKKYPGGVLTSADMGNSSANFATQAQIAASAFATYLAQTGGNPVTAEQIYQTGSAKGSPGEGAKLMAQYLGGATITAASPGSVAAAQSGSTGASTTQPGSGCSSTTYLINASPYHLINQCQAQQILGVALIALGALGLIVGFGIVLADLGLRKSAPALVAGAVGSARGRSKQAQDDAVKHATLAERAKTEGPANRQFYNQQTRPKMTAREPRPHRIAASSTPDF